MCGIIAYNGSDDAIPYLLDGIKNLEYRGYDSFGCALESDGGLTIKKDIGRIDDVINEYKLRDLSSKKAVFHTRWATHGGVEQKNAHPISDCTGRLAVAHNGIIENWTDLRDELSGHIIKSDTDTEVLAHIIENRLNAGDDLTSAVKFTFERINGSSSFVVIDTKTDNLVGVKKGSPLVLGLADKGNFISSDVPSFIKYTNKVVYLYDGDMVSVGKKDYEIVNLMGKDHTHDIATANLSSKDIDKGDYEHFMLKEIMEQPNLIKNLKDKEFKEVDEAAAVIRGASSVYIIGAGTSFHVARLGARVFRENGINAIPVQGHDLPSYKKVISDKDVFIIISQSGETADIINSMHIIKNNKKIGIINNEGSTLAKEVGIFIPVGAGPEKAVAATKTFTLSSFYIVLVAMAAVGKKDLAVNDINLLNVNLYNLFVPSVIDAVNAVAGKIKDLESIFLLGRDLDYVLALEGALKFKETTYIHAEAVDASTFKHGPLALISDKAYAISLVSEPLRTSMLSNLHEVKARRGNVIGISDTNSELFDMFIRTPEGGMFSFISQAIILQLLSYKTAVLKGIDMDHPRNLAKTVTVL
jgi:glucosamine--fructose-6-phosphate aminotransferase (isomerizing)